MQKAKEALQSQPVLSNTQKRVCETGKQIQEIYQDYSHKNESDRQALASREDSDKQSPNMTRMHSQEVPQGETTKEVKNEQPDAR
jgi:hypothetical protein